MHRFDGSTFNYHGVFASSPELERAIGFTFDESDRLVAGRETAIHIFDRDAPREIIDLHSAGLREMAGVAAGPEGHIYASDATTGRIFRVDLTTDSNPVTVLPDRFGAPRGIAFDRGGALLAADGGTTPALVRLAGDQRSFGGFFPGDLPEDTVLQQPFDVAIDHAGNIAVADRLGHRLLHFSSTLNFINAAGEPGDRASLAPRSVAFAVLPRSEGSFDEWRQQHFSESELADDSISGLTADPMGDGTTNLLRYGLGAGPRDPLPSPLPARWTETIGDQGYLYFNYTRARGRTDLTIQAEASGDLIHWEPSSDRIEIVQVENLGEVERITLRYLDTINSVGRRFFRIRITYAP